MSRKGMKKPSAAEPKTPKPNASPWLREFVLRTALPTVVVGVGSFLAGLSTSAQRVVEQAAFAPMVILGSSTPKGDILEGDILHVDVQAISYGVLEAPAGVLAVAFPSDLLRPADNESQRNLSVTTKTARGDLLPDAYSVRFVGIGRGVGHVDVALSMPNSPPLTKTLNFSVSERSKTGFPSVRNFSGQWHIALGRNIGSMTVVERHGRVMGEYTLSNGERGAVDGLRDGGEFRATLHRGAVPMLYSVAGVFNLQASEGLEIRGSAIVVPNQADAPNIDFYAAAKAPP